MKTGFLTHLRNINSLLLLTRPRLRLFLISLALLFTASILEGIGIGLIIPLMNMTVNRGNFSSLFKLPFVGYVIKAIPNLRLRDIYMFLILGIVGAVCIKNFFVYISELIISKITRDSEHILRSKLFERYLSFSKVFFDNNKIGNLSELVITEVDLTCDLFHHLHTFVQYSLMVVVYMCLLCMVSWKLTLISLLILPWQPFLTKAITDKIMASSLRRFNINQQMTVQLYESLSNMSLIRSYSCEGRENQNFSSLSRVNRGALFSIWKKLFFAPHMQEITMTIAIAVLFTVCAFVLLRGQIQGMTAFLSFFIVLRRFTASVSAANMSFIDFSRALVPLQRILWIFDDKDKQFIKGGHLNFTGFHNSIELRNARFKHHDREILKNVNLVFKKGKMTALVGHTGAGKTTLISLIPRFYDLCSGELLIDDTDIRKFELKSLRRKIAFVEQDPAILNMSIRENITYGLEKEISSDFLDEAVKKTYLYEFIMSLPQGYDTRVGDRGVRLSGGEKQRIALARALLKNPEIFIFDEATSSLDVETEKRIQEAMDFLMKGRTVIAVAHRLTTIRRADNIVVIEKGEVIEQGNFQELMLKKGRFHTYWNLQALE